MAIFLGYQLSAVGLYFGSPYIFFHLHIPRLCAERRAVAFVDVSLFFSSNCVAQWGQFLLEIQTANLPGVGTQNQLFSGRLVQHHLQSIINLEIDTVLGAIPLGKCFYRRSLFPVNY